MVYIQSRIFMENFDKNDSINKISQIKILEGRNITLAHIETLIDVLEAYPANRLSFGYFRSENLVHPLAVEVIREIIKVDEYEIELIDELFNLAEKSGIGFTNLILRAVQEEKISALVKNLSLFKKEDYQCILTSFSKNPTIELAHFIFDNVKFDEHFDLDKLEFAGIGFHEFVGRINDLTLRVQLRNYISPLLNSSKYEIKGVELFYTVVSPEGDLEIVESLSRAAKRMSLGNTSHASVIEDCISTLRLFPSARKAKFLLRRLFNISQIDFYRHRELLKQTKRLIRHLEASLGKCDELILKVFELIKTDSINPAVYRYIIKELNTEQRKLFSKILETSNSSFYESIKAGSEEDVSGTPIFDPSGEFTESYDEDARIWMKNNAIIARFYEPLKKSSDAFSELCKTEWERHEDPLTERLANQLFNRLKKLEADNDIKKWIEKNYKYGAMRINEPFVRDIENEWGADLGLTVRMHIKGILDHEWGYLFQAKKAEGEGEKATRWDIKKSQLNDLMMRTDAGFYLLYTPTPEENSPFVIPARTILSSLSARGGNAASISLKQAKLSENLCMHLCSKIFLADGRAIGTRI